MRKVSKKMSSKLREYSQLRKAFLFWRSDCEVKGCNNLASEIHHQKGKLGELLFDYQYFLPVCRNCHIKIENNRAWAMEKGYSLDRLKK